MNNINDKAVASSRNVYCFLPLYIDTITEEILAEVKLLSSIISSLWFLSGNMSLRDVYED